MDIIFLSAVGTLVMVLVLVIGMGIVHFVKDDPTVAQLLAGVFSVLTVVMYFVDKAIK